MCNAPGEFIIAMIDAVMFIKANIGQASVATPAMCMNHTGDVYFASDTFGAKVRLVGPQARQKKASVQSARNQKNRKNVEVK